MSKQSKSQWDFGELFPAEATRKVYSVGELTEQIRRLLEKQIGQVWVSGEVTNFRAQSSGHIYFTLKDAGAQIACVLFRAETVPHRELISDGQKILLQGDLTVYEARGQYQLIVRAVELRGIGALQIAFEKLKQKLAAEGLFAPERKRPLPRFPQRVGIVTSPRGAAIADMVQILSRRSPGIAIRLYPALVQGEGSVEDVCRGIRYFSKSGWADLVIVGRGGGSLEDLWTFNHEAVARAIADCATPVVSAVGHETDVTIADFVADLRAPTPSAAAELVVPDTKDLLERVANCRGKCAQAMRYRLAMLERRLRRQGTERALNLLHRRIGRGLQQTDEIEYRMRERMRAVIESRERSRRALDARLRRFDIRPRLAAGARRLETARLTLAQVLRLGLAKRSARLDQLTARLSQLSPLLILQRGYAIVSNPRGIVKEPQPAGERIHIRVARGEFDATAE